MIFFEFDLYEDLLLLLLPGAELPLMVESFGLLNDLFPFPSILDTGYQVFYMKIYCM